MVGHPVKNKFFAKVFNGKFLMYSVQAFYVSS
jgi:hypothetical protein